MTIILNPHLTEKSSLLANRGDLGNVYTFMVEGAANKPQILLAVKEKYKVTPIRVRIIKTRGRKKALVALKKGEGIQFS